MSYEEIDLLFSCTLKMIKISTFLNVWLVGLLLKIITIIIIIKFFDISLGVLFLIFGVPIYLFIGICGNMMIGPSLNSNAGERLKYLIESGELQEYLNKRELRKRNSNIWR